MKKGFLNRASRPLYSDIINDGKGKTIGIDRVAEVDGLRVSGDKLKRLTYSYGVGAGGGIDDS